MNGTIPSEIGNASNLEKLQLFETGLTGSLPTEIGRLSLLSKIPGCVHSAMFDNVLC